MDQSTKDALADAETLMLVICPGTQSLEHYLPIWAECHGWEVIDAIENNEPAMDCAWLAKLAARAAFLAVPGLRG